MDDTTPATKGDLQKLELSMNVRFEKVDEKFEQLLERFDREHEDVNRVLDILMKVKNKTDDHDRRIVRLEEAVV